MEHICRYPFLHGVDYARLAATSRLGALYTGTPGGALAEMIKSIMQMKRLEGFDLAMFHICRYYFLDWKDYDKLHASSLSVRDTVSVGILGNDMDVASDYDSSSESDTSTAVWMLPSTPRA